MVFGCNSSSSKEKEIKSTPVTAAEEKLELEEAKKMLNQLKEIVDLSTRISEGDGARSCFDLSTINEKIKELESNIEVAEKAAEEIEKEAKQKQPEPEPKPEKTKQKDNKVKIELSDKEIKEYLKFKKTFKKVNEQLKAVNESINGPEDFDKFMSFMIPLFIDNVKCGNLKSEKYVPKLFEPVRNIDLSVFSR